MEQGKDRFSTHTSFYDLSVKPCSFDFLSYIGVARTHGVDHVRFVKNRWASKDYRDPQARFDSIIAPACKLVGMPYSYGEPEGVEYGHLVGDIIKTWEKFGKLEPFGRQKSSEYVTVTLRNSRKEMRNSNMTAWMKFSKEIGALVIPDYDDKPIALSERLKIYEHAKLNMFVNNGPAILCIMSDMPYAILKFGNDEAGSATSLKFLAAQGLPKGSQWPFATEKQRIFWSSDTYEDIWKAYEEMSVRV